MLAKSCDRGADAVIADLEDSVHPREKEAARRATAAWLPRETRVERWVRINAGDTMRGDVAAIGPAAPDGIVLPKVQTAADIAALASAFEEAGCHPYRSCPSSRRPWPD